MAPTEQELKREQAYGLWLSGRPMLESEADAVQFLKSVKIALRYNATPTLPMAAMQRACGDARRCMELTNVLLASREAIETNVVADRLVLLHRSVAPAVYSLRRRNRDIRLSANAERAFELILSDGHASSGDVRRFLGVYGLKRPDPGDIALSELQREFLIDRGPSSVPRSGIPYLSPEGYPYRVFEKAHLDVVRAAAKLTPEKAARTFIQAYLEAAVSVAPKKMASMFRSFLSLEEIESALMKPARR